MTDAQAYAQLKRSGLTLAEVIEKYNHDWVDAEATAQYGRGMAVLREAFLGRGFLEWLKANHGGFLK